MILSIALPNRANTIDAHHVCYTPPEMVQSHPDVLTKRTRSFLTLRSTRNLVIGWPSCSAYCRFPRVVLNAVIIAITFVAFAFVAFAFVHRSSPHDDHRHTKPKNEPTQRTPFCRGLLVFPGSSCIMLLHETIFYYSNLTLKPTDVP